MNTCMIRYIFCIIIILFVYPTFIYAETEAEFYYRRGKELYEAKQYNFAIENMEKALTADPTHYRAANMLGKIYRKKKLMKKSLDYYLMSHSANPSQSDVHYIVGTLYDNFFSTIHSTKHYVKAIEIDPSNRYAHLKLVRYFILEKNDTQTANKHQEISFSLGKSVAEPFLKDASRESSAGRETAALKQYRSAVKKNPADFESYFRISEIYVRKKEFQRAVRWLEKITYIRPDFETAYVRLGNLYFTAPLSHNKKFLYEMAVRNLETALKLNPKNRDALLLLADVHSKSGNLSEAEKLYKKFERMEKDQR